MKDLAWLMSLAATIFYVATAASGAPPPHESACREFIEQNCRDESPRECLLKNKSKLPAECAAEVR